MANIRHRKHSVPCPTCNEGELYFTNQVVCQQCWSDIERGRKARETEEKQTDGGTVRIQLGTGFLYKNHLPEELKDPFFEHRNIREWKPLAALILSITGQPVDWSSGRDTGENSIYAFEGSSYSAVVSREQANNIRMLADYFGAKLFLSEQEGFRKGQSLLTGLASGKVSVQDFEDQLAKRKM